MSLNAATVCCLPNENDSNKLMKEILPNDAGKLICPPQTYEQRGNAYKVVGSICDRELRKFCINNENPDNILSESCVKWCNANDANKNECKRVVKNLCVGPKLSNNKFCSVDYCGPNETSDFGWCEENINAYCNSPDTFAEPICQKFCNNPGKKDSFCDNRVRRFCKELDNKPEYCTCFKPLSEIPGWESGSYPEYETLVHCLARPCVEGKAYLSSQQVARGCPASTSVNVSTDFDSTPKPIAPTTSRVSNTFRAATPTADSSSFKPLTPEQQLEQQQLEQMMQNFATQQEPKKKPNTMIFVGIGAVIVGFLFILFLLVQAKRRRMLSYF